MALASDFNEFCGLLIDRHVDFVIVGAYALAFRGAPRFTGDLAIYVRHTEDNGARLLDAVAAVGFPTDPVTPQDIAAGQRIIQMGIEPVQIHVMSDISGVSWDEVWQGRVNRALR